MSDTALRDLLHSEKDALQDIQDRWREHMKNVRQQVADIVDEAEDFEDVMEALNALAADGLASLTTDAAKLGVHFGDRKVKLAK